MSQINEQKFHAFIGKMLGDLGGAFSVPTTRIGFRLGLFEALNAVGPATAADLAARAGGLAPRAVMCRPTPSWPTSPPSDFGTSTSTASIDSHWNDIWTAWCPRHRLSPWRSASDSTRTYAQEPALNCTFP